MTTKEEKIEIVDEFFVMLSELAHAKDVIENGVNDPMTRRSLHSTKLTLHEILEVKIRYYRSLGVE